MVGGPQAAARSHRLVRRLPRCAGPGSQQGDVADVRRQRVAGQHANRLHPARQEGAQHGGHHAPLRRRPTADRPHQGRAAHGPDLVARRQMAAGGEARRRPVALHPSLAPRSGRRGRQHLPPVRPRRRRPAALPGDQRLGPLDFSEEHLPHAAHLPCAREGEGACPVCRADRRNRGRCGDCGRRRGRTGPGAGTDRVQLRRRAIFTVEADGSNRVQLTGPSKPRSQGGDYFPAFSPDGARLAFVRIVNDGEYSLRARISLMDADGGNREPLTRSGRNVFNFDPEWAPGGGWLAFTRFSLRRESSAIVLIRSDGTGRHAVVERRAFGLPPSHSCPSRRGTRTAPAWPIRAPRSTEMGRSGPRSTWWTAMEPTVGGWHATPAPRPGRPTGRASPSRASGTRTAPTATRPALSGRSST